jgi:tetratricopeptide (TPR) repeat protein
MTGRVLRFPRLPPGSPASEAAARRILALSPEERRARASKLGIEEPETLLAVTTCLREELETAPSNIWKEAGFFYRFLETPKRQIGFFDEGFYFLGELALIAGTACRCISHRDEARLWFDRSEAAFRNTVNPVADLARLGYQRLALRLEERQLEPVLEMAPPLEETFRGLGMTEDALKCSFLEGLALLESSRLDEARQTFDRVCLEAGEIGNERLLANAYTNLTHIYGMLGDAPHAIETSRKAIPILKRINGRIALAKVQWGLAVLLRETGELLSAIESYRKAQREFERIGMKADVAALSLVIADLLLECGREKEATAEVLKSLPVIDDLRMVPESVAALSILRESLRHKKINRIALRDLHGYFEDLKT